MHRSGAAVRRERERDVARLPPAVSAIGDVERSRQDSGGGGGGSSGRTVGGVVLSSKPRPALPALLHRPSQTPTPTARSSAHDSARQSARDAKSEASEAKAASLQQQLEDALERAEGAEAEVRALRADVAAARREHDKHTAVLQHAHELAVSARVVWFCVWR
jgi:hypothetical protein